MKHNILLIILTTLLSSTETVYNDAKKIYVIKHALAGKEETIIKKEIEHITDFARSENWDGISIENQILPFAERYLDYSITNKNVLIFDSSDKEYTINVHSPLYPTTRKIDASVDDAELNSFTSCISPQENYTSVLSCLSKSTQCIIAASLIDHNFNINDTRVHTLYTSKNNRKKGCAKDLLIKAIRLAHVNSCDTFSLYAESIGALGYQVQTSTLFSLYEKIGLRKRLFENEMTAETADLVKKIKSDPSECITLIF